MNNAGSRHRFRVEKTRPPSDYSALDDSASAPAPALQHDSGALVAGGPASTDAPSSSCLRCKRTKKKCNRASPRCSMCDRAGVACFYPHNSSTTASTIAQLRARVEWLSSFVDGVLPPGHPPVAAISTGTDLAAFLAGSQYPISQLGVLKIAGQPNSSLVSPPDIDLDDEGLTGLDDDRADNAHPDDGDSMLSASPQASSSLGRLPPVRSVAPEVLPVQLVEAFFQHIHRSYPFLDKTKTMEESSHLLERFKTESVEINSASVKVYLLMGVGCEVLCRSEKVSYDLFSQFQVPYHEVTRLCLGSASIESLQILLLLALYSLFDPDGWSPWTIAGLLGRQAISLGLNRKIPANSPCTLLEKEFRHRLFWSIFSLDRLVGISFGLPFAIDDNDASVPLPGVTMEEYAASEQADYITTLQIARQAIDFRELEGRIMTRIHLSGSSNLDSDTELLDRRDRRRIVDRFRAEAENWYTQGCLLARLEPHEVPIHNTIPWLNVNYHGALMLLYCPSHFNSHLGVDEILELQRALCKYVQSAYIQYKDHHLSLNHTTINKMLVTCRTLLHCCLWCVTTVAGLAELQDVAIQCIEVLQGFPPGWTSAKKLAVVFDRFVVLTRQNDNHSGINQATAESNSKLGINLSPSSHHGSFSSAVVGTPPYPDQLGFNTRIPIGDNMDAIIHDSELLLQEAVGVSSIHNYLATEPRPEIQKHLALSTWPGAVRTDL